MVRKTFTTWNVYGLIDPRTNLIRYVGVTFRGLDVRLSEHIRDARLKLHLHSKRWISSLLDMGLQPKIHSIESGLLLGWQDAERKWIKHYISAGNNLTNHTGGGAGSPFVKRSESFGQLISRIHKGRTISQETRTKISQSLRGSKLSAETIAKRTAKQKGKIVSPETRRRLSMALTGKKRPPEFGQMTRARFLGHTPSEETRRKRSLALIGRKRDPEVVVRIVATKKAKTSLKLSDKIKEVKAARKSGLSYRKIATLFNAGISTVFNICNGKGGYGNIVCRDVDAALNDLQEALARYQLEPTP